MKKLVVFEDIRGARSSPYPPTSGTVAAGAVEAVGGSVKSGNIPVIPESLGPDASMVHDYGHFHPLTQSPNLRGHSLFSTITSWPLSSHIPQTTSTSNCPMLLSAGLTLGSTGSINDHNSTLQELYASTSPDHPKPSITNKNENSGGFTYLNTIRFSNDNTLPEFYMGPDYAVPSAIGTNIHSNGSTYFSATWPSNSGSNTLPGFYISTGPEYPKSSINSNHMDSDGSTCFDMIRFSKNNDTVQDLNISTHPGYSTTLTTNTNAYSSGPVYPNATKFSNNDSDTQSFNTSTNPGYPKPSISDVDAHSHDSTRFSKNYNSTPQNHQTNRSISPLTPSLASSTPLLTYPVLEPKTPAPAPAASTPAPAANTPDPATAHPLNGLWPLSMSNEGVFGESGGKLYSCSIPGCRKNQPFTLESRLTHARKAHKQLYFCNCPGCPQKEDYVSFETKLSLDEHWRSEHRAAKRFRCTMCWYSTENITNMRKNHLKMHYKEGDFHRVMKRIKEEKNNRNASQE